MRSWLLELVRTTSPEILWSVSSLSPPNWSTRLSGVLSSYNDRSWTNSGQKLSNKSISQRQSLGRCGALELFLFQPFPPIEAKFYSCDPCLFVPLLVFEKWLMPLPAYLESFPYSVSYRCGVDVKAVKNSLVLSGGGGPSWFMNVIIMWWGWETCMMVVGNRVERDRPHTTEGWLHGLEYVRAFQHPLQAPALESCCFVYKKRAITTSFSIRYLAAWRHTRFHFHHRNLSSRKWPIQEMLSVAWKPIWVTQVCLPLAFGLV